MKALSDLKILVVGAGGIGCELLKILVLAGVRDIDVVDLDTVDVSNLNRQFLFGRSNVGQPKALVAAEKMNEFRENCNVRGHYANIKKKEFDLEFFKSFDVVVNALDNVDARRHVNRASLAAHAPLIDAGTGGYSGQVTVISKGETECFECGGAKTAPKEYAYCTVHTTPTLPIHCVVWAKELFQREFTSNQVVSNGQEALLLTQQLFQKEYITHIQELNDMRKNQPKINVFDRDLDSLALDFTSDDTSRLAADESLRVWELEEALRVFLAMGKACFLRRPVMFDKDDVISLQFLTACVVIRCLAFNLSPVSLFDMKDLVGNVVPSIATTNAIISGATVLQIMKLVRSGCDAKACTGCTLSRPRKPVPLAQVRRPHRFMMFSKLLRPNPSCMVCGRPDPIICRFASKSVTFGDFIDIVLKRDLSFNEPMVVCDSRVLYETGDDLEEEEIVLYNRNREKTFEDMKLDVGSSMQIEDYSQSLSIQISLQAKLEVRKRKGDENGEADDERLFVVSIPEGGLSVEDKVVNPESKRIEKNVLQCNGDGSGDEASDDELMIIGEEAEAEEGNDDDDDIVLLEGE